MDVRRFLPTVYVFCLLFCGAIAASAQCQNQGCQRPSPEGNPNCYTCTDLTGYACSLSGTCPQSCTETICPDSTDPCVSDPNGGACACKQDPSSAACVCYQDPNGGPCACAQDPYSQACVCYQDPNSAACQNCPPNAIDCFVTQVRPAPKQPLAIPDFRHRLLPKEMMATIRKPSSAGCQVPDLPKKLLFSL